jgi:hypothetical protein
MKKILLFSICILFLSCGQNQQKTYSVVVSTALISYDDAFGWMGRGSMFFNPNNCVQGYLVQIKNRSDIITSSYCAKESLNACIETLKYEISIKDSIVYTYKIPQ